jgi:hypothetical protein
MTSYEIPTSVIWVGPYPVRAAKSCQSMSESSPDTTDASVLGKRDRNGQQDDQATTHEEHTSKKMNTEDDSDSDDDVGPMPIAPGAAVAKKKRKGASDSLR